jgi:hypothetical protein
MRLAIDIARDVSSSWNALIGMGWRFPFQISVRSYEGNSVL